MDTNNNTWRPGKHLSYKYSVVPAFPFRDMCKPSLETNVRDTTYLMIVGVGQLITRWSRNISWVDGVSVFKCGFDATINFRPWSTNQAVWSKWCMWKMEDVHSTLPAGLWGKWAHIKYFRTFWNGVTDNEIFWFPSNSVMSFAIILHLHSVLQLYLFQKSNAPLHQKF